MKRHTIWSCDELDYLKNNYKNMTYKEISYSIGRTEAATKRMAERLGLRKGRYYKYRYNRNFFEKIDSEEKAYWLGFISADGCIANNGNDNLRMKLTLSRRDRSHLEKLNRSMDSNIKIRDRVVNLNGRRYHSSEVVVHSKKICSDLIELGVVENKTRVIKMPNISKEYINDYLRGLIDGDGSFYIAKRSGTDNYRYSIDITGASLVLFEQIKEVLHTNDIKSHIYVKRKDNWKLTIHSRSDILKLIDYLYKDSTIYLDRKYHSAMNMKEKLAV